MEETGALFAANQYSIDFSKRVSFFAASEKPSSFATSRREFIGKAGTIQSPQALKPSVPLSGAKELDGDPAAVLAIDITLAPGESRDVTFFLGDTGSKDEAAALVKDIRSASIDDAVQANRDFLAGLYRQGADFNARSGHEQPDQYLAALSEPWLPHHGAHGLLSGERCLRLPRPVAGYFGVRRCTNRRWPASRSCNAASRQFREG